MISAESVKERLKNLAVKEGHTMQDNLVSYAMERSIYRLSISKYADHFVLKGGIFLYALFGREFPRATVDIDFLARSIANNPDRIMEIFRDIFSIEANDALGYDLESLTVKNITEFKKYHGVNVSIVSYLDRTKIPVSIDIGFGDVVYPECVEMNFPVLLNMEAPKVYAYSIYSVIAEKFEAIKALGLANSRYKDFYDIYQIARSFNLDGEQLKTAVQETFEHRGTVFDDIVAFEPRFIGDETRIQRWNAFIKKKNAIDSVDFIQVVNVLKGLLVPVVDAIKGNSDFEAKWDAKKMKWE